MKHDPLQAALKTLIEEHGNVAVLDALSIHLRTLQGDGYRAAAAYIDNAIAEVTPEDSADSDALRTQLSQLLASR